MAGGNLAASVAYMAKERNGPKLALQVPIIPCFEARCVTGAEPRSTYKGGRLSMCISVGFACCALAKRAADLDTLQMLSTDVSITWQLCWLLLKGFGCEGSESTFASKQVG